ncbi:MAG TPA: hypothetical protein VEI26_03470 [Terriglobales bacterium]|nr:hypothetical protein [Terriglobales bacterium]
MRVLRAGALYFAIVFGVGFLLGPIRILWIVPRVGTRTAELIEAPIMLAVSVFVARWVVRWLTIPPTFSARLGMRLLALVLMLAAELSLVLWLRRMSVRDYFAERDPVAGTAYYVVLGAFAVMPQIVARRFD